MKNKITKLDKFAFGVYVMASIFYLYMWIRLAIVQITLLKLFIDIPVEQFTPKLCFLGIMAMIVLGVINTWLVPHFIEMFINLSIKKGKKIWSKNEN